MPENRIRYFLRRAHLGATPLILAHSFKIFRGYCTPQHQQLCQLPRHGHRSVPRGSANRGESHTRHYHERAPTDKYGTTQTRARPEYHPARAGTPLKPERLPPKGGHRSVPRDPRLTDAKEPAELLNRTGTTRTRRDKPMSSGQGSECPRHDTLASKHPLGCHNISQRRAGTARCNIPGWALRPFSPSWKQTRCHISKLGPSAMLTLMVHASVPRCPCWAPLGHAHAHGHPFGARHPGLGAIRLTLMGTPRCHIPGWCPSTPPSTRGCQRLHLSLLHSSLNVKK